MLNADNKRLLNNNGSLNDKNIKDKISSILEQDKFSIPSDGAYQLVLPIAALILFGIIFLINSLFIKNQKFSFYILLLIIGIIMLLCVIVIPLIFYSNKLIKENQNKIESLEDCFRNECNDAFKQSKLNEIDSINTYCFDCLKIQEGNVLNAYNLFSYEQILKIEERVGNSEGKNRAVFSYSTYRDDGEDVGIAEAEAIVQANKRKGVKYYEIFYSDQEGADIDGDENEIFINLSKVLGKDEIEKCLDYRFYKDSRFDIMIYQWDDDDIEGYFCLNFPLVKECDHVTSCPLVCTLANANRTSKVFYKKMVPSVTLGLHQRLKKLVEYGTK